MEKKVSIPSGIDLNKNIMLQRLRIDPRSDVTEPPVYCKISNGPTMTAGNFSLINGKAKSGKTFLLGAMVGSMINNSAQLDIIQGCLPTDKNIILYFDTEQSTYHATRTVKRICKLINNPDPENLIAYGLRPLTPAERLAAIEEAISTTDNLGAVAIDGIRDLLTMGINDEAEATSLTSKFLKWTSDYSIHIILLLHQNKTDLNARGHIGTEILNKSETVLSVSKDKSNIFIVSCEYSRDIAFDDFGFIIDNGMIISSCTPESGQLKGREPQIISDEEHIQKLDLIFKDSRVINRTDLTEAIQYHFNVGVIKSRDFIYHYVFKKWITKEREGKNVKYVYQRAMF